MLELEGVRSGYGKLEILQSASLRVADGAIVGIIGPNGAGKSTLLKTAFGYLAALGGPHRARRARDRGAPARRDHALRASATWPRRAGCSRR